MSTPSSSASSASLVTRGARGRHQAAESSLEKNGVSSRDNSPSITTTSSTVHDSTFPSALHTSDTPRSVDCALSLPSPVSEQDSLETTTGTTSHSRARTRTHDNNNNSTSNSTSNSNHGHSTISSTTDTTSSTDTGPQPVAALPAPSVSPPPPIADAPGTPVMSSEINQMTAMFAELYAQTSANIDAALASSGYDPSLFYAHCDDDAGDVIEASSILASTGVATDDDDDDDDDDETSDPAVSTQGYGYTNPHPSTTTTTTTTTATTPDPYQLEIYNLPLAPTYGQGDQAVLTSSSSSSLNPTLAFSALGSTSAALANGLAALTADQNHPGHNDPGLGLLLANLTSVYPPMSSSSGSGGGIHHHEQGDDDDDDDNNDDDVVGFSSHPFHDPYTLDPDQEYGGSGLAAGIPIHGGSGDGPGYSYPSPPSSTVSYDDYTYDPQPVPNTFSTHLQFQETVLGALGGGASGSGPGVGHTSDTLGTGLLDSSPYQLSYATGPHADEDEYGHDTWTDDGEDEYTYMEEEDALSTESMTDHTDFFSDDEGDLQDPAGVLSSYVQLRHGAAGYTLFRALAHAECDLFPLEGHFVRHMVQYALRLDCQPSAIPNLNQQSSMACITSTTPPGPDTHYQCTDHRLAQLVDCLPELSELHGDFDLSHVSVHEIVAIKAVHDIYEAYYLSDTSLFSQYSSVLLPAMTRFYRALDPVQVKIMNVQFRSWLIAAKAHVHDVSAYHDLFPLYDTAGEYLALYQRRSRQLRNMCEGMAVASMLC